MKNGTKGLLFLLFLSNFSFAQVNDSTVAIEEAVNAADSLTSPEKPFVASPTIALGTGLFSFFGDVYVKHFQSPTVSRIGYDLTVSQRLSDEFQLNFYVLFGKLGANERLVNNNRNVNFESQIRAGGVNMQYNFGHFLPATRTATPYISLGFESFEFLSKTDAFDQFGNEYHYWADGTIRNIDENAVNAASAVEIKRDYSYESDIREMNLDKFGKYAERSIAVPLGVGAVFKVNDFIDFKIGTTIHFTFTDYIDGITFMSKGNRQGNNKNDNFMMSSCAISYNFGLPKRAEKEDNNEGHYKDVDFFALDTYDYDKDGVTDPLDSCQCTPIGVIVDTKGCPLDDDADCYVNYKDDELNSPAKAWVNTKGVQLTDQMISDARERYLDESMKYAQIVIRVHKGTEPTIDPTQKMYSVSLGTYQKGLPAEVMTKFLSVPDIASNNLNDSTTMYTAGVYNNLMDVNYRKQQLIASGLTNAKVVYKQFGRYNDAPEYTGRVKETPKTETVVETEVIKPAVVETKVEETKPVITETPKTEEVKPAVVETKVEETKPVVTETIAETPKAEDTKPVVVETKVEETKPVVIETKVEEVKSTPTPTTEKAIVADGLTGNLEEDWKRISNDSPKMTKTAPTKVAEQEPVKAPKVEKVVAAKKEETQKQTAPAASKEVTINTNSNALNVPGVVLRVQLGAYQKPLSKKVFRGVHDLIEIKTADGLYKYMSGAFSSFEDAAKHKLEMAVNGYPGAFITAYKDGQRIALKDAGATAVKKGDDLDTKDNVPVSAFGKDLVKYKVQLGIFKNQPPDEKLAIFAKLKDVTGEKTVSGLTRYVAGSFNSYKEAEAYKNEIIKTHGISDPFVVATYNNEYISIQEALELQK